jgi:hypothetical protein
MLPHGAAQCEEAPHAPGDQRGGGEVIVRSRFPGRWTAPVLGALSVGAAMVITGSSFMTVFTTDAARSHVPEWFRPGCSAWNSCEGNVFGQFRGLLSWTDHTGSTALAVVAALVAALAVAGFAFAHRRPAWTLTAGPAVAAAAAIALHLQFILVVQQFRTVDLAMGNNYIYLRPSGWGVAILGACLVPVLASVGLRLAAKPLAPGRANELASRASVAAGLAIVAFSLVSVFIMDHARSGYPDNWARDVRCPAWRSCPGEPDLRAEASALERLSTGWVDYTALTRWLLLAAVVVAIVAPAVRLRAGRPATGRLARSHLPAAGITVGLLWLHHLLVVLQPRSVAEPGTPIDHFYLRPTYWGGLVLVASLVVLVAAFVIARQRHDGDRDLGGQSRPEPDGLPAGPRWVP